MSFTGTALYDIYSNEIGEDVSQVVSMISPREARFLDDLPQADFACNSKYYTWEEDALLPDTYSVSSAISSSAAASYGLEVGANAEYLRVKDVLELSRAGQSEQMIVTSIGASAATIYVSRAYAGTSATSFGVAGDTLSFIGSAVEEGASARQARRVGKVLKGNFTQSFREDINISNLANKAGMKVESLPEPFEEEKTKKAIEVVKQLERAVLLGRTNGNTIGAANKETTMAGIINSIATNTTSHGTFSNSILNVAMGKIDRFADLRADISNYSLYCGNTAYSLISNNRATRIEQTVDQATGGVKPIEMYYSDYGAMPIKAIRWIPAGTVLAIRKDYVRVKPFAGNSFAARQYDDGSSAKKGYVEGTYGLEFHQEKAHAKLDGISA